SPDSTKGKRGILGTQAPPQPLQLSVRQPLVACPRSPIPIPQTDVSPRIAEARKVLPIRGKDNLHRLPFHLESQTGCGTLAQPQPIVARRNRNGFSVG